MSRLIVVRLKLRQELIQPSDILAADSPIFDQIVQ